MRASLRLVFREKDGKRDCVSGRCLTRLPGSPNIQLRLVELDEFRANLLDVIHIGTFCDRTGMVKKGKGFIVGEEKAVIVND